VRNIGRFAVPRPPADTAIITVQLRERPDQLSDGELSAEILTRMRRLGLFGPYGVAAGIARDEITMKTMSKASSTRIARLFPDRVTVLRTVDLSDRIHPLPGALDRSALDNLLQTESGGS
jgi:hypothetical protein